MSFRVSSLAPYFTVVRTTYSASGLTMQHVCKANPDRSCVYFSLNDNSALALDYNPNATAGLYGIYIPTGGLKQLYWQLDGILTTLDWYWYPQVVSQSLCVTELVWQPPES